MGSLYAIGVKDISLSTLDLNKRKLKTMELTEYIYHGKDRPRSNGRFVKLREVD